MAQIQDDQLFEHSARVKDKVVVITGMLSSADHNKALN